VPAEGCSPAYTFFCIRKHGRHVTWYSDWRQREQRTLQQSSAKEGIVFLVARLLAAREGMSTFLRNAARNEQSCWSELRGIKPFASPLGVFKGCNQKATYFLKLFADFVLCVLFTREGVGRKKIAIGYVHSVKHSFEKFSTSCTTFC